MAVSLSAAERGRYDRHLRIPEVGLDGQLRLKAARVLVVGAGGLGCPAAVYLAAAGVGTIGLIDFDGVSLSNLQRQFLYDTADVGKPKVWRARRRLLDLNPDITVEAHDGEIAAANVMDLVARYDVVVDGSDNYRTRYLLNDACRLQGRPLVYAGIHRFEGQVAVFRPDRPGCYRCLFPAPPAVAPSCAEAGVLGVLPGTIGSLQATEALRLILGFGRDTAGSLFLYDALNLRLDEVRLAADPDCPLCGERPTITTVRESAYVCLSGGDLDEDAAEAWTIDPGRAKALGDEAVWLDVTRHGAAINAGLPARHVPFDSLATAVGDLDPARTYILICNTGATSAQAVTLLRRAGFGDAWHVGRGLRVF